MKKLLQSIYDYMNRSHSAQYCWKLRERALAAKGIARYYYRFKYMKAIQKNAASIPLQTQFAGVPSFPHGLNGIFVSMGAKVGTGCTIFHQVTIGSNTLSDSKKPGAPVIGNNVFIGAGAKIIGGVRVGDNVRIGANCVVATDIPDNSTVVLTAPKIITYSEARDNRFTGWNARTE